LIDKMTDVGAFVFQAGPGRSLSTHQHEDLDVSPCR
jgi:hypothetical protein